MHNIYLNRILCFLLIISANNLTYGQVLIDTLSQGNLVWKKANNPYIVESGFQLNETSSLTIEAGVVIKLDNLGGVSFNGGVEFNGTESDPIVFTSLSDDEYYGDTNGDGESSGQDRQWGNITINIAKDYILKNVVFKYGGNWYTGSYEGMVKMNVSSGTTLQINDCEFSYSRNGSMPGLIVEGDGDVIIEQSKFNGNNSTGLSISTNNSEIRENEFSGNNTAISFESSGVIDSNIIQENNNGISLSNSSPVIENNNILNNTGYPLSHEGNSFPSYTSNTIDGNGYQAINIGGAITTPGHVLKNSTGLPYIVLKSFYISEEGSLNIPSGTVIKLDNLTGINFRGDFVFNGTATAPVVFTSISDDSYFGDTNGDGSSTGTKTQWNNITFDIKENSVIEHVKFKYGGNWWGGAYLGMVKMNVSSGTTLQINDCEFSYGRNASMPGLKVNGDGEVIIKQSKFNGNNSTGLSVSTNEGEIRENEFTGNNKAISFNSSGVIDNNIIQENTNGISLSNSSPAIENNNIINNSGYPLSHGGNSFPTYSSNTIEGNGYQAINIGGAITTSGHVLENSTGLPYIVLKGFNVSEEGSLDIPPGTIIKINSGLFSGEQLYFKGKVNFNGTASDPVVFTSISDDSYFGDTNGDGSSTGTKTQWNNITFDIKENSVIEHVKFKYGGNWWGGAYLGMVKMNVSSGTTLQINDCEFSYSRNASMPGLKVNGDGEVKITNSNFYNSEMGLHNKGPKEVQAVNNFWGDPSGPFHPELNPEGKGVTVGDNINFIPFSNSPFELDYKPVFVSTPTTIAKIGEEYNYNVVTHDDNSNDSLTITSPIKPTWLSFLDNGDGTAILSGVPHTGDLGNNDISLKVQDSSGNLAYQNFTVEVEEPTGPDQSINVGQLIIYADSIFEISTNVFVAIGHVNIDDNLYFDQELSIDKNNLTIEGAGNIYVQQIKDLDSVNLYQGDFTLNVSTTKPEVNINNLNPTNQLLKILNMPIFIEGITLIEDGIEVNGEIQLPKALGLVMAEINEISLTKTEGLGVAGLVEVKKIKLHKTLMLKNLAFEFDTNDHLFRGQGAIKTPLFEASAGVYIVEQGLDSVGVWVDVAHPQPLGTTGLALAGAGGYVSGIQNPPLALGIGTTLVPIGSPPDFISFQSLLLEYQLGTSMKGSGNFVLFDQALSNAYFEIQKRKISLGVEVNFHDILKAYMSASIIKNDTDGIDLIGKFGGELQIPDKKGLEFELIEALLRKILNDNSLSLPYSLAGTDNVIFNTQLTGRAWLVRPGKKDFQISYLLEYKDGKVKTDFAKGYRLFNNEVFSTPSNGKTTLKFLHEPSPISRLEGRSLILRSSSKSAKTTSLDQEFQLNKSVETLIVRVKGDNSTPDFEITDPEGNTVNKNSIGALQNYDYVSNQDEQATFIIIDFPVKGKYNISIDGSDNYLVDIIGNEGSPTLMINVVKLNNNSLNLHWTDNDQYDNALISFYLDTDNQGLDGVPIVQSIEEDDESDAYTISPLDSLQNSSYYVYGIMRDTLGNLVSTYFKTPITLEPELNAPTDLTYQIENDTLNLEWVKSTNCSGCDNLVFIADTPELTYAANNINVGDTVTCSLGNLSFGKTYYLAVAQQNLLGNLTPLSNEIEIDLVSEKVNNLPVIKGIDYPEVVRKGDDVNITFDLYDADNDELTLDPIVAPTGTSISGNTMSYSAQKQGTDEFFVKLYDPTNEGDSIRFFINVFDEPLLAPSIATNDIRFTNYNDSLYINVRNPLVDNGIISDSIQINSVSAPENVIDNKLSLLDENSKLFNGVVYLGKSYDEPLNKLKVSRLDTVNLIYHFDGKIYHYSVVFDGPNSIPNNIKLSNSDVNENSSDAYVGMVSGEDYDHDPLSYSLLNYDSEFQIKSDSIFTKIPLNFEKIRTYNIQIRVDDSFDHNDATFIVNVKDVNDPPTGIELSANTIIENENPGTLIGLLSTADEDENDSFKYSLVSKDDFFKIQMDRLLSNAVFDYEKDSTYLVNVKSTDSYGEYLIDSLQILVVNATDEVLRIDEEENDKPYIFPNPINNYLIINWNAFSQAVISDLSGKPILKSNSKTLKLDQLQPGVYFIRLQGKRGKSRIFKFIKN